jgi:membrane protease subunit HflC
MKAIGSLLVVAAVLAAVLLGSALYRVTEFEFAVVTQFGKPVRVVKDAGLYWKTPFVQTVNRIEKRVLAWDGDPNDMITQDKKSIYVDTIARWKVVDPERFYVALGGRVANGMKKLDDIVDGVVRDVVGENKLLELVRTSDRPLRYETEEASPDQRPAAQKIDVGRETITDTVVLRAREGLEERFGIRLIDIRIKRVNYTESVSQDVYNRMRSERNRISQRYLSEAEEQQNIILGEMAKELAAIHGEANQRVAETRGQADALAIEIYARAIRQAPDFYRFLRTLEAYEKALDPKTTLILSTDSPLLRLLKEDPLKP